MKSLLAAGLILIALVAGAPPRAGVAAGPPPVLTPITATFAAATTTYRLGVTDPSGGTLAYSWSKTAERPCGSFTFVGSQAQWVHPDPPCPAEAVHPGTITFVVRSSEWECTAVYPFGSAIGTGPAPAPCVALAPDVTPTSAPSSAPSSAATQSPSSTSTPATGPPTAAVIVATIILVALATGTWFLFGVRRRKPKCPPGQIKAETAQREDEYRVDYAELKRLRSESQKQREAAEAHDREVADYETDKAVFETDLRAYDIDLAAYSADIAPPHGASSLFTERERALTARARELATRLGRLEATRGRLNPAGDRLRDAQAELAKAIAALVARVTAFHLVCVSCAKVNNLAQPANAIVHHFRVDDPGPVHGPVDPVPGAPALPPVPVGAGGGGSDDEERHTCTCALSHHMRDDALRLAIQEIDGPVTHASPYYVLVAEAEKPGRVVIDSTYSEDGAALRTDAFELHLPFGGATYEWQLLETRVVSSATGKTRADVTLIGRNGERGTTVHGPIVVLHPDMDQLFEDWVDDGVDPPQFGWRFVPIEIGLRCTARWKSDTAQREVTVRFNPERGDHYEAKPARYLAEVTSDSDVLRRDYVTGVRGSASAGPCRLDFQWARPALTIAVPPGIPEVRSGEPIVLGVDATSAHAVGVRAEGSSPTGDTCEGGEDRIADLPVRTSVSWQLARPGAPAWTEYGTWALVAMSGESPPAPVGLPVTRQELFSSDIVLIAPDVDEETVLEVRCTAVTMGELDVTATAEAALRVKVIPRRLKLKLIDSEGHAYGDKRYELYVEPVMYQRRVSLEGLIDVVIPGLTQQGVLRLFCDDASKEPCCELALRIGDLYPLESFRGVRARLDNLGLFGGFEGDLEKDPVALKRAVQRFKSSREPFGAQEIVPGYLDGDLGGVQRRLVSSTLKDEVTSTVRETIRKHHGS